MKNKINIKLNGNDVPYISFSIKESFNCIATEVKVEAPIDFLDNDVEINGYKFTPVRAVSMTVGSCVTTFYPKSYVDWCKKLYQPVIKTQSFEDLMKYYGIDTVMLQKSEPVYWCLPEMKFNTLLTQVKNYVQIPNGGGVVMTVGFNSKLRVCDLKRATEGESVKIAGRFIMKTIS